MPLLLSYEILGLHSETPTLLIARVLKTASPVAQASRTKGDRGSNGPATGVGRWITSGRGRKRGEKRRHSSAGFGATAKTSMRRPIVMQLSNPLCDPDSVLRVANFRVHTHVELLVFLEIQEAAGHVYGQGTAASVPHWRQSPQAADNVIGKPVRRALEAGGEAGNFPRGRFLWTTPFWEARISTGSAATRAALARSCRPKQGPPPLCGSRTLPAFCATCGLGRRIAWRAASGPTRCWPWVENPGASRPAERAARLG